MAHYLYGLRSHTAKGRLLCWRSTRSATLLALVPRCSRCAHGKQPGALGASRAGYHSHKQLGFSSLAGAGPPQRLARRGPPALPCSPAWPAAASARLFWKQRLAQASQQPQAAQLGHATFGPCFCCQDARKRKQLCKQEQQERLRRGEAQQPRKLSCAALADGPERPRLEQAEVLLRNIMSVTSRSKVKAWVGLLEGLSCAAKGLQEGCAAPSAVQGLVGVLASKAPKPAELVANTNIGIAG